MVAQLNDEQLMVVFGLVGNKEAWVRFCNDTMAWMLMKHPDLVDGPQKQPGLFKNCVEEFIAETGPVQGTVNAADANRGDLRLADIIHAHLKARSKYIRHRVETLAYQEILNMARSSQYADVGATPPSGRTRAKVSKQQSQGTS